MGSQFFAWAVQELYEHEMITDGMARDKLAELEGRDPLAAAAIDLDGLDREMVAPLPAWALPA